MKAHSFFHIHRYYNILINIGTTYFSLHTHIYKIHQYISFAKRHCVTPPRILISPTLYHPNRSLVLIRLSRGPIPLTTALGNYTHAARKCYSRAKTRARSHINFRRFSRWRKEYPVRGCLFPSIYVYARNLTAARQLAS